MFGTLVMRHKLDEIGEKVCHRNWILTLDNFSGYGAHAGQFLRIWTHTLDSLSGPRPSDWTVSQDLELHTRQFFRTWTLTLDSFSVFGPLDRTVPQDLDHWALSHGLESWTLESRSEF